MDEKIQGVTLPGIGIEVEPENFSFLKLHGSVGAWTIDQSGMGHPAHQRCYFESPDADKPPVEMNDDYFFDSQHPGFIKRPPILYFPFHRQFILSSQTVLLLTNTCAEFWKRAAELIAKATEIHVIGYSFAGIDRVDVLEMIETASE